MRFGGQVADCGVSMLLLPWSFKHVEVIGLAGVVYKGLGSVPLCNAILVYISTCFTFSTASSLMWTNKACLNLQATANALRENKEY